MTTELPENIIIRRDIFIIRDSIYVIYENYRKNVFYIGKCIGGEGSWNIAKEKGINILEIFPVALFFTEVL